jgi:hypothetical protein
MTLVKTAAAAEFELESVTVAFPVGASPLRVTVPVTAWPPGTELGDTETAVRETAATLIVRVADADVVSRIAWMETLPPAKVPIVVIGNVAVVAPEGTVTVA